MKKYLGVLLAVLVMAGCTTQPPEEEQPAPVTPVQPAPQPVAPPPAQSQPLPAPPPKIQVPTLNWDASVTPLVQQMLQADGVTKGSILLVGNVKNSTNGSLQTGRATEALYKALAASSQFTLVSRQQLGAAKQTLGLSEEDSLASRSKAVGLARYVGAQYVLYADASGDVKAPDLAMQLMLVQTGEIIWSGNGSVHQ